MKLGRASAWLEPGRAFGDRKPAVSAIRLRPPPLTSRVEETSGRGIRLNEVRFKKKVQPHIETIPINVTVYSFVRIYRLLKPRLEKPQLSMHSS